MNQAINLIDLIDCKNKDPKRYKEILDGMKEVSLDLAKIAKEVAETLEE